MIYGTRYHFQMKWLIISLIFLILGITRLFSQNTGYQYLINKNQVVESTKAFKFYCGLTHQHQSFFDKPFSFTGIETGVILRNKMFLGAYGSSFLSNLEVENSNSKTYFSLAQGGLVSGVTYHSNKWFHPGALVNIGYFCLTGSSSGFQFFDTQNPTVTICGLVLTPQAFAGINVLKWMKLRLGFGYSFYTYNNQSVVSKSDLQHVSINFAFLFGKFI